MFYVAIAIIVIYLWISITIYKQIPVSLSDTFYLGNKYWFTGAMFVLGILLSMSLLDVTSEVYLFLAFFSGAGLLFVGAAPHFKDNTEKYVHFGGAGVFGVASQLWVSLVCGPWLMLPWISVITWWKSEQRTFWIELVCIINIIAGYIVLTL